MILIDQIKIKYYKVIFILILIIDNSNQAPTCNSFPKIFGGSGDDSFINQIDVFADYLTMAGGTSDITLGTGLLSFKFYPFIAVTSIAIPDKYYWAKLLSLKENSALNGI